MRPKIAETVPAEAWELLGKIRQIIDALPELIEVPAFIMGVRVSSDVAISKTIPNCHVLVRAIASVLSLSVHDGQVCVIGAAKEIRQHAHSWLTLPGHDSSIILDPWPLGVVSGPALFIQDYAYHFGPECGYLEHRDEEFLTHVDEVTKLVRKIAEDLWGNA